MFILLRHHRYEVQIGNQSHILRIEELISGSALWGGKFRIQMAANGTVEAKTLYGASADAVAQQAAELLNQTYS